MDAGGIHFLAHGQHCKDGGATTLPVIQKDERAGGGGGSGAARVIMMARRRRGWRLRLAYTRICVNPTNCSAEQEITPRTGRRSRSVRSKDAMHEVA